jgi:hypothetical protein
LLPLNEIAVPVHDATGNFFPRNAAVIALGTQPPEFDPEKFGGLSLGVEGFEVRRKFCHVVPHAVLIDEFVNAIGGSAGGCTLAPKLGRCRFARPPTTARLTRRGV